MILFYDFMRKRCLRNRSQSSRAQTAQVLSGLTPVYTDWSAFINYYRSDTMLYPNQLAFFLLLTTLVSLVTAEKAHSCFCVGKKDFDIESCTSCQQGTTLKLSSKLDRPLWQSVTCARGGLEKKTNHSLRTTTATVLFQANVPENVIQ